LAEGLAKAITFLCIAFLFALVILLVSLGVAMVLSDALGTFAGYGIVAGFYLIVGIILLSQNVMVSKRLEKKLLQLLKKKK
jgi:bacteriorhodopsin